MKLKTHLAAAVVLSLFAFTAISVAAQTEGEGGFLTDNDFKPGTAELTPSSDKTLNAVLAMLVGKPDVGLRIESFSDHRDSPEENSKLSKQRAQAVIDWLVKHGVDAARLVAEGFNDARPAANNNTAEGRTLNRRVALVKFDLKSPDAFLPVTHWQFEPVVDGDEVTHDFVIQNRGTAPLKVESVKTG